MATYQVKITTGSMLQAYTFDNVYFTLIGTEGKSERTKLNNFGRDFIFAQTGTYTVTTPSSLGSLLLVRLEKKQFLFLPQSDWFCSKVVVTTPESDVVYFPCYSWISKGGVIELRGGIAKKVFEDEDPLLLSHRKKTLEHHKQVYEVKMATYQVKITTGSMLQAYTFDNVYFTLIGTEGKSERTKLDNFGRDFIFAQTGTYTVTTPSSLGSLLLVRLEKEQFLFLPQSDWFCSKVVVTTPESDVVHFPCYSWISKGGVIELREGIAKKVFEDEHPLLLSHRKKELQHYKQVYEWTMYKEGLPDTTTIKDPFALPPDDHFSFTRVMEFAFTRFTLRAELKLKGLADSTEQWAQIEDIKSAFRFKRTTISEYVQQHWTEDEFFGYQLLNGANPMMIHRCTKLPRNFAVTDNMVRPFLEAGSSLTAEMQKGNIFLCDYRRMAGLPTQTINDKQQYVASPLCLLYKNREDSLLPIAIQLKQQPSEENPIFLPSDSEHDWQLAKLYVRNADSHEHGLNFHFLRTHLMAEIFTVAMMRNLPGVHPLHKLLKPHTRYTLQINTLGRNILVGPEGVYTQTANIGGEGIVELFKRSFSELTYSSLCLPEDIKARGLESIPNFYYRDDGLQLWHILNSFVKGMVEHYYPSDSEVKQDLELQSWIREVFVHGFLGQNSTGVPQCFHTVEEVINFITMVIFTVSAQHSAVNAGQFDYGGWFPNFPNTLQQPPPTTKGNSSESTILETLADISSSVKGMAARWNLSKQSSDFVPLGVYPEEYFCEAAPQRIIKELQAELIYLSESIFKRNSKLLLPYTYLCPEVMENSVGI